jgi:zinc transport system permease protein
VIRRITRGIDMLDDFFIRALLAAGMLAVFAGPLGCIILWRRYAYFGDTLAHSALLGLALALFLETGAAIPVFVVSGLIALILFYLQKSSRLASDALLGILSHSALALGLVTLSLMHWIRFDLTALLFGDLLAVSRSDLLIIPLVGSLTLVLLIFNWRALLVATVSPELAKAEGFRPDRTNLIFVLMVAGFIAIAIKMVGALLITALLVIPAAAARQIAVSPIQMAVGASFFGLSAVVAGLFGSLQFDTPSGPSIVLAAAGLFALSLLAKLAGFFRHKGGRHGA